MKFEVYCGAGGPGLANVPRAFIDNHGNAMFGVTTCWEEAAAIALRYSKEFHCTAIIALKLIGGSWPCNIGKFVNGKLCLEIPKSLAAIHEKWGA